MFWKDKLSIQWSKRKEENHQDLKIKFAKWVKPFCRHYIDLKCKVKCSLCLNFCKATLTITQNVSTEISISIHFIFSIFFWIIYRYWMKVKEITVLENRGELPFGVIKLLIEILGRRKLLLRLENNIEKKKSYPFARLRQASRTIIFIIKWWYWGSTE